MGIISPMISPHKNPPNRRFPGGPPSGSLQRLGRCAAAAAQAAWHAAAAAQRLGGHSGSAPKWWGLTNRNHGKTYGKMVKTIGKPWENDDFTRKNMGKPWENDDFNKKNVDLMGSIDFWQLTWLFMVITAEAWWSMPWLPQLQSVPQAQLVENILCCNDEAFRTTGRWELCSTCAMHSWMSQTRKCRCGNRWWTFAVDIRPYVWVAAHNAAEHIDERVWRTCDRTADWETPGHNTIFGPSRWRWWSRSVESCAAESNILLSYDPLVKKYGK